MQIQFNTVNFFWQNQENQVDFFFHEISTDNLVMRFGGN